MENHDLRNLVDCILSEANSDKQAGKKVTTYQLPPEALVTKVLDVLPEHFKYFDSCNIDQTTGLLTLKHPDSYE
ncbi:hypothetical protein O1D40_003373 [Vibrio cholerae]|nr:hypothetical protein [Vibrio cholerae]EKF9631981.1 hypothetical protein [Vibrio cholerae]EKF9821324.1 hypothetical protein [Vibrio cholerae]